MADPLSIAASVGGLALLARDIVKLIVSVTSTVRGATSQLQELRQSVALLYGYLESLSLLIDDDKNTPAPMSILACNRTLEDIRHLLKKFDAETSTSSSSAAPTKNGTWQDLRQKVRWVIDKDEAAKLLADLERHKSVLSLALSKKSLGSIIEILTRQDATLQKMDEIRREQSHIRQQQIQDSERWLSRERRKMLNAVSDMRPEDSLKKHLSLRQDGTGVWFLESPELEKFMGTPNSKLWLYGIPGAGKSVLSATIIDHISTQRTEHVALAFFFCEYFNTATQTCRIIFGSIARQLALQNPRAFENLEEFFNNQTDLGQFDFNPEDAELLNLVVHMSTNFDSTIVVIDGLDECQENRASIVEHLAQLSRDGVGSIKTLYASRKESDILERLTSFEHLTIAASKADVRLYVAAQLKSRFRKMCEKDPALSEQILKVLIDKSEGMFQWVRCQIDCLENLASNKQRRKALEDLPRDLRGTYERILLRAINLSAHATLEFVGRTLRWIALAKEPLSVAEITHAISVEVDERSLDESLDIRIILALCSSLVREVGGNLAFSHFSVKEYLMQISPEEGQVARFRITDSDNSLLAQTCLTYLLLDDFDRKGCVAPADLRPVDDKRADYDWKHDPYPRYPFYSYAACRWIDHAETCSTDNAILTLIHDLFKRADQFIFWAHFWLTCFSPDNLSQKMYGITPLHLACTFCLTDLVDVLICNGAKVNIISPVLGCPLQCAISGWRYRGDWNPDDNARYQTVRRLLCEPVNRDQGRYDPVTDALKKKDEKVAHALLEHGFTLTKSAIATLDSEATPDVLLRSDLENLDAEIQLFMRKKLKKFDLLHLSQANPVGAHQIGPLPFHLVQDYKEAIKASCCYGRLDDVKNLLSRQQGLIDDRLPTFLSQCLIEAAAHGHADVVQFLTEISADPTFQRNSDGRTALHEASCGCHVDVVKTLLEISNDKMPITGIQDNEGLTPWMCAIERGCVEVLDLFLTGPSTVDLRTPAKNGQTAAHLAALSCKVQMISYLKKKGAEFACTDVFGKAPVHALLEPYCGTFYWTLETFESLHQTFRHLQWGGMLSGRMETGQTLVHLIAQMEPWFGKSLWQDVQDNQIFDDNRGQSLTMGDPDGNTPLHLLVHNLTKYLKEFGPHSDMLCKFVEFVSLLLSGNEDASEQLGIRNKRGRTPVMELLRSIRGINIPYSMKKAFSDHIPRVFRILGDARTGSCHLAKADNDKHTAIYYIAACRSNFPFKEITESLLERPIDVTAKESSGGSALLRAALGTQDNVDFMRLLIPRMSLSQLEEEGHHRTTILHYILKRKKVGVQDLVNDCLIHPIGECEKKDRHGRIPLTYAPAIITNDAIASKIVQASTAKTINSCDNNGKSCMYWSCELGSIAMVSALLDAGANIDAPLGPESPTGAAREPPLLIAASSKQFGMVEFLLGRGADPLVKGEACWQLHHYAFDFGRHELLTILENLTGYDYDAKASFTTSPGSDTEDLLIEDATPLHFTAVDGDKHCFQWLLDHDKISDIDVETRDGSTPLILASIHGWRNMCKRLTELGSIISKPRHDGYTALHAGCQYGHLEICKLLIATDNSCVFQNFGVQTPLEIATSSGHKDIVELLLKHDAQATIEAEISARKASHHDIAEFLRRRLAIGNKTSPGNLAIELDAMRLKAACDAESESMLTEVLQKDINPNIRLSYKYRTPLHLACRNGWKEAAELLLERNASIEALDEEGRSPLMIAINFGQQECIGLLRRKSAQTTTRDATGFTALHWAAQRDDFASLSQFFRENAEANVKTYTGLTPLHLLSDPGCVDLLLENGADPFILGGKDESVAWVYSCYRIGAELLKRLFRNQPAEKVQQSIETCSSSKNSTSLYRAAFLGHSDVVSTLIEYGAKVNGRCGPLGAPFHAALRQGHVEIATTLLENGARPYRIVRESEENAVWFWEYGYQFSMQGRNGVWVQEDTSFTLPSSQQMRYPEGLQATWVGVAVTRKRKGSQAAYPASKRAKNT